MTEGWTRFAAIILLAMLGGGIVAVLFVLVSADGKLGADDGGWLTAGFLSLREVFSKIEKISLGVRTPAPPLTDDEMNDDTYQLSRGQQI